MLWRFGVALVGSLGSGMNSAFAQSVYFEIYAEPFPIVEAYQAVIAPRYIVRPAAVAPSIVRERIVVSRPGYVDALGRTPMPPYVVADW